jgi:Tfp pilus assembly protein PilO
LIPDKTQSPLLIRYLENLSLENQVTLENLGLPPLTLFDTKIINSTASAETSQADKIPLTIRVSGNYTNIMNFIDQLTKLSRLINVVSITITTGEKTTGQANMIIIK